MKNKIFNAIQKGLSNVLIFDDNDSSIAYQKSNANNDVAVPKVSLEELYDIFKNDKNDIFSYDTKDYVSLILDNGYEISLHEYQHKYQHNCNIVFLKISNDMLKIFNNEIIIACNNKHYISNGALKWQMEGKQILPDEYLIRDEPDDDNNFNTYSKCQMILKLIENKLKVPSINYCNEIKSPLLGYKGYLPSICQLNFISKYIDMINYIFEYANIEKLNLRYNYCSSSEYFSNGIWYLAKGNAGCCSKTGKLFTVLPLFILEK